jgi:hypothetical protein
MTAFLLAQLVLLVEEAPEPEDVKAGWTAFVVVALLIAAVAFLGFSLAKQLRKAQAAEDAGVYGSDEEPDAEGSSDTEDTEGFEDTKGFGDTGTPDAESESHQAP